MYLIDKHIPMTINWLLNISYYNRFTKTHLVLMVTILCYCIPNIVLKVYMYEYDIKQIRIVGTNKQC